MSYTKYNIININEIFSTANCKLLSIEYKPQEQLEYICSCGTKDFIKLYDFIKGKRCKNCSIVRKNEKSKLNNTNRNYYTYNDIFNFFKTNNCTLLSKEYINNNQILEYICSCGEISKTRFRLFKDGRRCKKCGRVKAIETNKSNHNGILYQQTQEFKDNRKLKILELYGVESPMQNKQIKLKREQTNLLKYGVRHVSQVKEISNRQRQGFINKYGVSHFMKIPKSKNKFMNTLMKKYNVPSLAHLSKCSSKESQTLFDNIYKLLPTQIKDSTYYATLNSEFTIYDTKNERAYKYDFVNSSIKKAIEYNGYNFHPKENQNENEINWCAFHPNKTVKEAREYETEKYDCLISRNYEILTVWDYELHDNLEQLIKKCINFLLKDLNLAENIFS